MAEVWSMFAGLILGVVVINIGFVLLFWWANRG